MKGFLGRLFGRPAPQPQPQVTGPEVYARLHALALTRTPADFGLPADVPPGAYAMLVDMGYPGATVTLFFGADGTASLYVSTGGGVIGGHAYTGVRDAVTRALAVATELAPGLAPAHEFPAPVQGDAALRVLTADGVREGGGSMNELASGRHALSRLFLAANDVLTQLRLATAGAGG